MPNKGSIPRICGQCGVQFFITPTAARRGEGKYCSQHCSRAAKHERLKYREEDRGYTTPCWIWQGGLSRGYGYINRVGAHRVYFERIHGPVPEGKELDHVCKQKACVNPDHLEAVTHTENLRRGPATILTWEQAMEIRALCAAGELRQREIAALFGITKGTVGGIATNRTWTHRD